MGMLPDLVAHADWGCTPRKRVIAVSRRSGVSYQIVALAAAADGDLLAELRTRYSPFQALIGFDFPLGLPRDYARAAGIESFVAFLDQLGAPRWADFARVAEHASEI